MLHLVGRRLAMHIARGAHWMGQQHSSFYLLQMSVNIMVVVIALSDPWDGRQRFTVDMILHGNVA